MTEYIVTISLSHLGGPFKYELRVQGNGRDFSDVAMTKLGARYAARRHIRRVEKFVAKPPITYTVKK